MRPTAGNAGTGLSLELTAPEGRGALQQGSFIAVSRSPAQAKALPRIGFGSNAGFRDPWLRSSLTPSPTGAARLSRRGLHTLDPQPDPGETLPFPLCCGVFLPDLHSYFYRFVADFVGTGHTMLLHEAKRSVQGCWGKVITQEIITDKKKSKT